MAQASLEKKETSAEIPAKMSANARWLVLLALIGAVIAVFWPVTRHDFINLDDPDYVTQNPFVQAGLTWAGIKWAFTSAFSSNWHPLTWLSHMLDCQLFGLQSGWHHFTNLLFHAANTTLVFLLFSRITGTFWRSVLIAGLFGLHPLHVESVAWVAERKDVLSTFFGLLALLAYHRYALSARPRSKTLFYLLASSFYLLSLAAKPMLVTLPFLLLLLDFWPLQRTRTRKFPALVIEKLPFIALAAISSVLTLWAQNSGHSISSTDKLPIAFRITNAICAYANYLANTFWPTRLAIYYPHPGPAHIGTLIASALALAGISFLVWRNARLRPWHLVGWLWFLGTMVPVIGLVQVGDQAMADRYTYVPLLGIFLMLAWEAANRFPNPRNLLCGISAGIALLACGVLSAYQVTHWKSTETVFQYAHLVTKNNYLAKTVLGTIRASQGKTDEAIALYSSAIEIKPNYPEAYLALGAAYQAKGEQQKSLDHLQKALALNPHLPEANRLYGLLLAQQRNWSDAALHLHEAAIALPGDFDVALQLAVALHNLGKIDQAVAYYKQAVSLKPDSATARQNLGNALLAQGNYAEAIAELRQVLRLTPDAIEALTRLTWILATQPDAVFRDGTEAIRLANRACELSQNRDPRSLLSLSAALAETGRFNEAGTVAQQALDLASQGGQKSLAEIAGKLLELYQAGKPYREAR